MTTTAAHLIAAIASAVVIVEICALVIWRGRNTMPFSWWQAATIGFGGAFLVATALVVVGALTDPNGARPADGLLVAAAALCVLMLLGASLSFSLLAFQLRRRR